MKKNQFSRSAMLAFFSLFILLCGCSKNNTSLLSGTYILSQEKKGIIAPNVTLNNKDHMFRFNFDPLSSYAYIGTFKIEDDKVIGKTDDDKFTYVFRVIDKDTIEFLKKDSDSTITAEGKNLVADGARFELEVPKLK